MKDRQKNSELSLLQKAEKALREAVAEVIETRRRAGETIAIWRDGKVVRVHPDRLAAREPRARYGK